MDVATPQYYALAYLWCITATYCVALMNCIVDSIITTYSHCIAAHFKSVTNEFQTNHGLECQVLERLPLIVQYHNWVLELFTEFQAISAFIIFFEYGISSLQVCVCAYQITLHTSDPKILFLISFTISIFVQLCMYSYNGDLLLEKVYLYIIKLDKQYLQQKLQSIVNNSNFINYKITCKLSKQI